MKLLIGILFIIITYNVYSQEVNTDYKQFFYPNSTQVSSEGFLTDGKPDGYWKSYYQNGILKSEGNRVDFLLDGEWKFYDENGNVTQSVFYKEGKKNGLKTTFSDEYIIEENYFDDLKNGMSYMYDSTYLLLESVNFKDGVENGLKKEFARDGRVVRITNYKSGFIVSSSWVNKVDNKKRKQGKWVEFHDNDVVSVEMNYLNDKLTGYAKYYDRNGSLTNIEKYANGEKEVISESSVKVDIRKDYHSNGQLKTEMAYKNGVPDGIRRDFDTLGNIVESYIFKNGKVIGEGIIDEQLKRHGDWVEYYFNGNKKSEGTYNNGKKVGYWQYFNIGGTLEQEGYYDDEGRYTDIWIFYYPSGNILKEESFVDGLESGMYMEYSEEGDIIVQGNYVNGMKQGIWTYNVDGVIEKGEYLEDKKNGYWSVVYEDGVMIEEGNFVEDNPDGVYKWYYTNGLNAGKIFLSGSYLNGVRHGEWVYFDVEGNIELLIEYDNGEELNR